MSSLEPIVDQPPLNGIGQVPAELERVRVLYKERAPKRVLEIGCWYGGTLREWLREGTPELVVAVDPTHLNPERYEDWRHPDTTLVVARMASAHAQDLLDEHGPFDWIFIDGDHSEQGLQTDVPLALRVVAPGGLILFHDIAHNEIYLPIPPRTAYYALAENYESWEIIEEPPPWYPAENAHGIGVVQC